jgi:hypothetical protein
MLPWQMSFLSPAAFSTYTVKAFSWYSLGPEMMKPRAAPLPLQDLGH